MADQIEAGDDRPVSRRGTLVAVLVAVLLGGSAVTQHLSAPGEPAGAPAGDTATPSPARTPTIAPTTAPAAAPPSTAVPGPWASLPVGRPLDVDFAAGRVVRSGGRTLRLEAGTHVITMDRAADGPVLLVQSRGTVLLEQLRPDGRRLVLEEFPGEGRLPQGAAVDPTGRRVAYALTAPTPSGPFGLVVRELATGAVVASRRTRLPFGVRDWTSPGVTLTVAAEPGRPPFVWRPGTGRPVRVAPLAHDDLGPFLLAASPARAEWAVTLPQSGCTELVRRLRRAPERWFCGVPLGAAAEWSPSGTRIAALSGRRGVWTLDTRTGSAARLGTPRHVFVRQVAWHGEGSVLVAVQSLTGGRSAVLRCAVGHGCRRAPLAVGGPSSELVLAR